MKKNKQESTDRLLIGTGSILDALRQQKPLIAVVNTGLMDNHQQQVASSFSANGQLIMCEPTFE